MWMSMQSCCSRGARGVLATLGLAVLLAGCSTQPAPPAARDAIAIASALQTRNSIAAVAPAPGELVVTALLVDPGAIDANGDGAVDPVADESVTLANRLAAPLDLAGVGVHDATRLRYVFPPGAYLPPGGQIVVYGSDAPLSLDDDGDRVRLVDRSGVTLHEVSYTGADVVTGKRLPNLSLQGRSPPPALTTSAFLGHDRVPGAFESNSPGTVVDGLPCRQVGHHTWSCPLPLAHPASLDGHGRVFGAFKSNSPGTTVRGPLRWRVRARARSCPISPSRAG